MNLETALQVRSHELCRLLAGCIAVDPVYTLRLAERLKPQDLTDENARRYILAMRKKLTELQTVDDEQAIDIAIQVAYENNLLSDYARWVTSTNHIYTDAPQAIRGLQSLAVTQNTLHGLTGWLRAAEEYAAW